MKTKVAYLIDNIEDYGKLLAYCIENDICVWRTYWDEREKTCRCYNIDYISKRCFYATKQYYVRNGYVIIKPQFEIDKWGNYILQKVEV